MLRLCHSGDAAVYVDIRGAPRSSPGAAYRPSVLGAGPVRSSLGFFAGGARRTSQLQHGSSSSLLIPAAGNTASVHTSHCGAAPTLSPVVESPRGGTPGSVDTPQAVLVEDSQTEQQVQPEGQLRDKPSDKHSRLWEHMFAGKVHTPRMSRAPQELPVHQHQHAVQDAAPQHTNKQQPEEAAVPHAAANNTGKLRLCTPQQPLLGMMESAAVGLFRLVRARPEEKFSYIHAYLVRTAVAFEPVCHTHGIPCSALCLAQVQLGVT